MAKYIINIPDDGQCQYKYNEDTKELKFPCPRIDPNSFMGLDIVLTDATPYTEPDRKAIEDAQEEAWEFAKQISIMNPEDKCELWGTAKYNAINLGYSYHEAKARYDAWKKKNDEIRVGDEVEAEPGNKACVLYENPDGTQVFVFKVDGTAAWWSKCAIHKTGKNHPEVEELLKKMKEIKEESE